MRQPRTSHAASVDRHIGGRLRFLREAAGLTQAALGKRIGEVSGQAVAKYEAGEALPVARMFWTAAVLGVPVSAFFEGLEIQSAPPPGHVPGLEETAESFHHDGPQARTTTPGDEQEAVRLLRSAPASRHGLILSMLRALSSHPEPCDS